MQTEKKPYKKQTIEHVNSRDVGRDLFCLSREMITA